MKYLKFLNLIPLCMFFLMYFVSETVLHMAPLLMVFVFGIMNAFISKDMKEYLLSSLMLLLSSALGMIFFTYYYYHFIDAADEAPIFGAAVVIVYGCVVIVAFAIGAVIKVIKDRSRRDVEDKADI